MENQGNANNTSGMSPQAISIIAYITIIGWLIAFVLNNNNRSQLASFHIRQFLGIFLTGVALGIVNIIPILGWIISIVGSVILVVLWVMGILSAVNMEQKPVPILGEYYQQWFRNI